jgi:hypothetical protein
MLGAGVGCTRTGKLAGDQTEPGFDVRLEPLAAHVLAGHHYECAWELFRFGHFKGLNDDQAARELGALARRQGITVAFEVRKVRGADVYSCCCLE